jgi:hypothetical protein
MAADKITATITEFCAMSGIGRSRVYELINAGVLESALIGERRFIIVDSYRRYVEQRLAAGGKMLRPGTRLVPSL